MHSHKLAHMLAHKESYCNRTVTLLYGPYTGSTMG